MERFDWAALARRVAEDAGFRPLKCPTVEPAFTLDGEVSPYLEVFFEHVTNVDVAPEALLGIWIEEFERDWRERLLRTAEPVAGERPPFHLLAANVKQLVLRPWSPNAPSPQDVAEVRDYLNRTFEYAKRLPSSMDSLVAAIQSNRIGDHAVWFYLGHPVKVRGFTQWMRRIHAVDLGDRLLAGLSDETEPYDVRVMLDDG